MVTPSPYELILSHQCLSSITTTLQPIVHVKGWGFSVIINLQDHSVEQGGRADVDAPRATSIMVHLAYFHGCTDFMFSS